MVRFSSSSVAAIDSQTPFSTSGTSISRLGIGFLAVRLWSGNLFYPIRREMSSMRTTPLSTPVPYPRGPVECWTAEMDQFQTGANIDDRAHQAQHQIHEDQADGDIDRGVLEHGYPPPC